MPLLLWHENCHQSILAAQAARLDDPQILGAGFACPGVGDGIEADLLAFIEATKSGALDGADMDEDVPIASVRLNEAEAFLAVKPFYCSRDHEVLSSIKGTFKLTDNSVTKFEIFCGEVLSQARCSRRGQVVRPNLNDNHMVTIGSLHKGGVAPPQGIFVARSMSMAMRLVFLSH